MSTLEQNRWIAQPQDFAQRIDVSDVSGFFYKNLIIEPGTKAMILENGVSLGELPPDQ